MERVYLDAYELGQLQSLNNDPNYLISIATEARDSVDPYSYLTSRFLLAIKNGDSKDALIYSAARRLYKNIGARLVNSQIDLTTLDTDLFIYACDSYIAGVTASIKD
jgi:hypothetical protein